MAKKKVKKEAISALSSVLWGYTTQDGFEILNLFFPPGT